MSELIRVPDIGSGEGEIIELFVKVGDRIEADQSLLTLESDKASMEIPAPKAGVIKELKVKLGDRLKEGDELMVPKSRVPLRRPRLRPLLPRLPQSNRLPHLRQPPPLPRLLRLLRLLPPACRTSMCRISARRARPRSSKYWSRPATPSKPTSR